MQAHRSRRSWPRRGRIPSFSAAGEGARNAPVRPLDGQRAGAAGGRRRLRVGKAATRRHPFHDGSPALPKSPQPRHRLCVSQASQAPAGGGVGARRTAQDAGDAPEDGRSTAPCRILEASAVIHSVIPSWTPPHLRAHLTPVGTARGLERWKVGRFQEHRFDSDLCGTSPPPNVASRHNSLIFNAIPAPIELSSCFPSII